MNANMLHRRTQVLLDDDRYARLELTARASGRSVGAVIRDAIDAKFARDDLSQRRRGAADLLLAQPLPLDPEPDWAVVKAEMLDGFGAPPA